MLLVSWFLLTHVGLWKHGQQVDTNIYSAYGTRVLDGKVPYRDFSLEYPPAALPVFVVAAIGHPKTEAAYRWRFEWLMALCGIVAVVAADAVLRTQQVAGSVRLRLLLLLGVFPLVLGPVILTRYDLWPAALATAALAAFVGRRTALGGALLGLGVAAKLYPVVMAPILIAYVWRREGRATAARALAALALSFGACVLPFAILAPHGTLHSFAAQIHRPLQEESLGAALLIAAHHLTGLGLGLEQSYGSLNLGGTRAALVEAVTTVVELAALGWVWFVCTRRRLTAGEAATGTAAAVAVLLAFGKVLSPQYLIWLIPLVAVVGRRVRPLVVLLLIVGCGLTQSWYPRRAYALAVHFHQPESWLLLARDLVLVVLAVVLMRSLSRDRETAVVS
jgi:uncharacterized membrane protein